MLKKFVKSLFLFIGISSLVLGFIGIFLPVLPTTPFILLAAYCFAKSSERFHNYIMQHKLFGKMVSDFYEKRIIPVKTKIIALTLMWATLLLSVIFFMPYIWVKWVVIGIGVAVTAYLLSFRSK
ncbi:MAG TPA: YbaN family protein [Bacteroidales bacterium]|nr:YbaN family protein [Bacteroidales bacterium]